MKRHARNLEKYSGRYGPQREKSQQIGPRKLHVPQPNRFLYHRQVRRAGQTVQNRKPISQNAGAERAHQHVLHRGFVRSSVAPQKSAEDVKAQRHRLQAQEQHHQIVPTRQEHHAHGGKEHQRVIFAVLLVFNLHVTHRNQNHQRRGREEQKTEENKKRVYPDGIVESRRRSKRRRRVRLQHVERAAAENHAEHRRQRIPGFLRLGEQKIAQQNRQAEKHQHRFRQHQEEIPARLLEDLLPGHLFHLGLCAGGAGHQRSRRAGVGCRSLFAGRMCIQVVSGMHALDEAAHRLVYYFKKRRGVNSNPERQHHQRNQRRVFARIHIRQMLVRRIRYRTEHHPLVQPQQIRRAQNHAERAPRRPLPAYFEHAAQNRELTDKSIQQRHAQRAESDDQIHRREIRHGRRKPAKFGNQPRVPPLVEHAHQQEERPGGNAVIDLLNDAAGKPQRREHEDSQSAEAHVADRRIRDELFHVLLHHADECPVNNSDQREHDHDAAVLHRRIRKHRQRKSQKPVRPHLQQHASQYDGTSRRRLGVRVRQPGVEWEHRHLDRKREKESPEQPFLQPPILRREGMLQNRAHVESIAVIINRQDREEHQHRPGQRVQEKFDRGVQPPIAAPDADQKIHRHQHHFPENVEQHEVQRHENAQHAGLQQQQQDVIFLFAFVDRRPGRQNRNRAQHRGQQHHQETQPVNSQREMRADGRNPVGIFHKLELRRARPGLKAPDQRQRDQQPEEPEQIAHPAMQVSALARNKKHQDRANQRREKDRAQDVIIGKRHPFPRVLLLQQFADRARPHRNQLSAPRDAPDKSNIPGTQSTRSR